MIFQIPDENMEALEKSISKLNKKAEKLGCAPVNLKVVRSYVQQEGTFNVLFHEVDITGQAPVLNGWHLAGQITHDKGGVALLRTIPGENIPSEYNHADPANCDHCHRYRKRNNTFVVRHNDGTYKQVGKTCLQDFTGHKNPNLLANFYTMLQTFFNTAKQYSVIGAYGRTAPHFLIEDFLGHTIRYLKDHEYVSKGLAFEENLTPTSAYILDIVMHQNNSIPDLTREEYDEADEIIAWVKGLDKPNNDYLINIQNIVNVGYVTHKTSGFATSMVRTYRKAMEKRKPKVGLNSVYLGNPKDRIEGTVTLLKKTITQGYYGRIEVHRFVDDKDNILVWFANTATEFAEGQTYSVKMTVKKHEEFNGIKQTVVNRVAEK